MKRSIFTVLVIAITVSFFSSCDKQEENILSIVGTTWEESNLIDHTSTTEVYWEFDDNDNFIYYTIDSTGAISYSDTGSYFITIDAAIQNAFDFENGSQNELVHSTITVNDGGIDGGSPEFINSVWIIIEKNDDRLVLMHDGAGQYTKEFNFVK